MRNYAGKNDQRKRREKQDPECANSLKDFDDDYAKNIENRTKNCNSRYSDTPQLSFTF